mmetsp:Transcript_75535/g.179448  ORF Transcript_75535/g.179448 Transcript_75535/m.179448 type:complete len:381 (-) Transcript_75535:142-1284(-)
MAHPLAAMAPMAAGWQPVALAPSPLELAKVGEEVKSHFVAEDGRRVTMMAAPPPAVPLNQPMPDGSHPGPLNPGSRLVCNSPPIWVVDDFLSAEECARIVQENDHRVHRSRLANKNSQNETRTSSSVTLHAHDALASKVKQKVSDSIGIRVSQCEQPEMVRYQPGQQYKDHFDWLHGDGVAEVLAESGQRAWTFLIYLVDVPEGGETRFATAEPEPLLVKPKVGRAVIWRNMLPDGRVDPRTLHAGLPPKVGTKYVLNTWTRVGDVRQNLVREGDTAGPATNQVPQLPVPPPTPTMVVAPTSMVSMSAQPLRMGPMPCPPAPLVFQAPPPPQQAVLSAPQLHMVPLQQQQHQAPLVLSTPLSNNLGGMSAHPILSVPVTA